MDVVQLAAELVAIDSTTGREGEVVAYVRSWLVDRGWDVVLQEVTPWRANVWARRGGGVVTLSTHLDTVPPFLPPRLERDRLCGRGACDAKGIAAAMMTAATELAAAGEERVDLLLVVGEERGSDGALAANRLPATSRFLVNGEPTESTVASGAKGSLHVRLEAEGVAAHSAYPERGASAIESLLDALARIRAAALPVDPVLGPSTVNIGTIAGGTAANVVPDRASAELMVRLVGDADPVRRILEACAGERVSVTCGTSVPACRFHADDGGPVVAFATDAPLLARWGRPTLFGPGSIHVAHTAHEHIDLDELRAAVPAYAALVRARLAGEAA